MCAGEMNKDSTDTSFGRWLSRERKSQDLTQEDLAERTGCSVWSIQKIEVGNRRPSKQVAEILADFFQIPAAQRESFLLFARGTKATGKALPPTFLPAIGQPRNQTLAT
jgi:transcriptional regulator with XRE-family HTH domain